MLSYARKIKKKLKVYRKVNWIKTLYFNFRMFPFAIACRLPVFFYGRVRFGNLTGTVAIEAPIRRGMIGFGQPYELKRRSAGIAELLLEGRMVFRGSVQFGIDYTVFVSRNATCTMGHMSSMGFASKLMCFDDVMFGDYARIGFESQIINSTVHQLLDTVSGERFPMTGKVVLGSFNYFGNRISIMKDTITPDYCIVASGSICNRDYRPLGQNVMIGGVPARLIRENISRDWESETGLLEEWIYG